MKCPVLDAQRSSVISKPVSPLAEMLSFASPQATVRFGSEGVRRDRQSPAIADGSRGNNLKNNLLES
jgi:hypothetical protein